MADNNKLRDILFALSTDEEKSEYLQMEKLGEIDKTVKSLKEEMKPVTVDNSDVTAELRALKSAIKNIQPTDMSPVVSAIKEMIAQLTPKEPQDLSGFFKDLGTQLAQFGGSSKNTEELIKNLKWNSTMGIKNRDGSPISPSISPFQIPDFDDIKLTNYSGNNPQTVTYYLGGGKVATLTITYDGSGNITEVKRI